jgi:hypothetical protein
VIARAGLARERALEERSFVLFVIVVGAIAAAALAGLGWPAWRYVNGDFVQYWLASTALLTRVDPYDPAAWVALHRAFGAPGYEVVPGLAFLYPLMTAALTLPFAFFPLAIAAPLWFVCQTTAACIALVSLGRRIFGAGARAHIASLLAMVALMQPGYILAGGGNIARFLPSILAGSLALLLAGRPLAAGIVLGFGVVKPHLFLLYVPALLLFVAPRDRARLLAGLVVAPAVSLAASVALRPDWVAEWTTEVGHVNGVFGLTTLWGITQGDPAWIPWTIALLSCGALVVWRRVRRPPLAVAAGAAAALSVFVAPYAGGIDLGMLVPTVAAYLAAVASLSVASRVALLIVPLVASATVGWYAWVGFPDERLELQLLAPVMALALVLADAIGHHVGGDRPVAASPVAVAS